MYGGLDFKEKNLSEIKKLLAEKAKFTSKLFRKDENNKFYLNIFNILIII